MTDAPLKFHPLADIFPLMKGRKFDALVADIKTHGLREPIMLYQGKVLDGRNRYHAYLKAFGTSIVDCEPCTTFEGDDAAALAFVVSKNFYRRHLTAEQRRKVLIDLVAAQPGKSDRAIGREAGVDHKQVGRARRKGESTGAIDPVEKRRGSDGRTRRRPKKRPKGTRLQRNNVTNLDEAREKRRAEAEASSKRETSAPSGSFERWQAEAAAAAAQATAASATKERSEILEADLRWAFSMTASNGEAARRLYDLLLDEGRRAAFVEALGRAISGGNDTDPVESAETEEAPEKPRRRRGKAKEVEVTLEHAVHDAFLDLADLGEECRDVVDNAPEGLNQTQRIQTLDETASELENLQEPEVSSELAELPVKYLPVRVRSRATRCWAATEILEKCVEALATIPEGDERHAAASNLSSELDDLITVRDNCEFPGRYG
jgi:hypothetical protein